ncbi:hypothetical protein Esti_002526 [Eimeria stiedai]
MLAAVGGTKCDKVGRGQSRGLAGVASGTSDRSGSSLLSAFDVLERRKTRPLPAATTTAERARQGLGELASGSEVTVGCRWWTMTPAQDFPAAHDAFEHDLQELQWVKHLNLVAAATRWGLRGAAGVPTKFTRMAEQMRVDYWGDETLSGQQIDRLFRF